MKSTEAHLEYPYPSSHCRERCPVTSTCAEQNKGLVQFLSTAPHHCWHPYPPKFCLKLELVKELLEFHGNLLWFEGMTWYFPSLIIDQECGYWVQRWIMISGFPPPPTALALGFLSDERLLPRCLSRACYVEGLWLGSKEPTRPALGELLVLWAVSR